MRRELDGFGAQLDAYDRLDTVQSIPGHALHLFNALVACKYLNLVVFCDLTISLEVLRLFL